MNITYKRPITISRRRMLQGLGVGVVTIVVSGCGGDSGGDGSVSSILCNPVTQVIVASASQIIGIIAAELVVTPGFYIKALGVVLITGSNIIQIQVDSYCGSLIIEASVSNTEAEELSKQSNVDTYFVGSPDSESVRNALTGIQQQLDQLEEYMQDNFRIVESSNVPLETQY